MKVRPTFVAGAAALSLLLATPAMAAQPEPANPQAAPDAGPTSSYIVQFTPGSDRAAEVSKAKALGMQVTYEYRNVFSGMAVQANAGQVSALQRNPNVKMIEADGIVSIGATQVNPTWGLDRTDERDLPLDTAYAYSDKAGADVTAYIIDTGILPTHTEFGGRVRSGYTAITDGKGTVDCNGHGTHVAGTVGGTTWGMAKQVNLVAVRVLDCAGSGSTSGVIAGMDWAVDDHAAGTPAVANMSLGGGASTATDDAVARMVADGISVSVAAGNSNANACNSSPARAPLAITVGATQSNDARASYSNYGTCLDIFAPGTNITSAWYTGTSATNMISGTSMASPHVAGAAALYLGENKTASPSAVRDFLVNAGTTGKVTSAGTGSPNVLLYTGTITPPVAGSPTITSITPSSGPVSTLVTITGTNLSDATVTFGGTSAQVTASSATSITTSVPIGATTGPVVVTNGVGSASIPFTVGQVASAPQNLTWSRVNSTTARLSWSAPATGAPILSYNVRLGTSGTWTSTTGTSITARVKIGVTYTWQVQAVNALGGGTIATSTPFTFR